MAAHCSLLTDLKRALLIMVIIDIFCISIKIRNIFVVFVESMNIKRKRTGSQRLFPMISKGFVVCYTAVFSVVTQCSKERCVTTLKTAV